MEGCLEEQRRQTYKGGGKPLRFEEIWRFIYALNIIKISIDNE
jgi:hypothetical protein